MIPDTTYTIKLRSESNFETNATDKIETIKKAIQFIKDHPVDEGEEWYEIEVVDNLTECTVFIERKLK